MTGRWKWNWGRMRGQIVVDGDIVIDEISFKGIMKSKHASSLPFFRLKM